MSIDLADRLELHELAARYGDLIDARDWAGLDTVFTDDAVFAMTDGSHTMTGLDAVRTHMDTTDQHPRAHLIVNVRVVDGDPVILRSRVLGILADRRVGSGWYVDQVVRTGRGWRVRRRDFTMLRKGVTGPSAL
jgi:hypothetical protein